jgi:hypothetical protein
MRWSSGSRNSPIVAPLSAPQALKYRKDTELNDRQNGSGPRSAQSWTLTDHRIDCSACGTFEDWIPTSIAADGAGTRKHQFVVARLAHAP